MGELEDAAFELERKMSAFGAARRTGKTKAISDFEQSIRASERARLRKGAVEKIDAVLANESWREPDMIQEAILFPGERRRITRRIVTAIFGTPEEEGK